MLNWDLMKEFPHRERSGLQLADFVESAFYQAIDFLGPGAWDTGPAEKLYPIIATENGRRKDFGAALFPSRWWEAGITPEQEKIFRFYGYEFARR